MSMHSSRSFETATQNTNIFVMQSVRTRVPGELLALIHGSGNSAYQYCGLLLVYLKFSGSPWWVRSVSLCRIHGEYWTRSVRGR
ncbi:hypothetical protein SCLCIDRAFT_853663 [Scleroderma citrinum Foug A]|uniref:Uncharacterized protein n=1 Tax=Scleroderma citrinum Foug A TaxID=1036808 RepID=A0A0C3E1L1_9AGAM|nr:hypothetical protein SCLCIDRAFT_853663 [Scleroderma citrinum Foug A]